MVLCMYIDGSSYLHGWLMLFGVSNFKMVYRAAIDIYTRK